MVLTFWGLMKRGELRNLARADPIVDPIPLSFVQGRPLFLGDQRIIFISPIRETESRYPPPPRRKFRCRGETRGRRCPRAITLVGVFFSAAAAPDVPPPLTLRPPTRVLFFLRPWTVREGLIITSPPRRRRNHISSGLGVGIAPHFPPPRRRCTRSGQPWSPPPVRPCPYFQIVALPATADADLWIPRGRYWPLTGVVRRLRALVPRRREAGMMGSPLSRAM